jgi:hypothetical protein
MDLPDAILERRAKGLAVKQIAARNSVSLDRASAGFTG